MIRGRFFRSVLCVFLLLMVVRGGGLFGQAGIGDWQSHLSYQVARQVAIAGDRVYCGTQSGLYYFDMESNTVNILTKSDGLSDLEINAISYSTDRESLVIGYANTNIDIVEGDEIFNIPDIKRKQITANKTINNILIVDDLAYLSCGFGIVVVNLEKREIKDTYLIGENGGFLNVFDMTTDGVMLFAATESGIYEANLNSTNLVDYNNWTRITDVPHPAGPFTSITWTWDKLYVSFRSPLPGGDSLYYLENGIWNDFELLESNKVYHVRGDENELIVVTGLYATAYLPDHNARHVISSLSPVHADYDNGVFWVADKTLGMYRSPAWGEKEFIVPNGPLSGDVVSVALQEDLLYTAAGNLTPGWGNTYRWAELNEFRESQWSGNSTLEYRDLIHISIDPADKNHVVGSTWGYGMIDFRSGEIAEVYDQTNSSLQVIESNSLIRLGGSVYDQGNNLWVTNAGVEEPISVRKTDGKWKSFALDGKLKLDGLGRIINTYADHKWVICPLNHGLFAMDLNGSIDDISDDSYEKFDIIDVNGKVISNNVYALAEDKDNNIWVGTDKGIVVYYSPTRVFEDEAFYGQQIIVPRNDGTGLADILLGTEKVTAIAVDGANRKWIGTAKSGVYLVSDDGLEEVHHFTEDDSPLLSNTITDIAINPENGIVYIGTDAGLISYKSTAIDGKENFGDVYVYPNPVRHDYEGEIVITGLVGNVNVKITDIGGNIVFETTALGGQAIWNGRNFSGNRVSTGVYMVFCTNEDGSQTHITKLLVIN
jgi:hypothetical protein